VELLPDLIFSFCPTFTVLDFSPFQLLMSAVVQPYFFAIELSVSPFFTTWVFVVAPDEVLVLPELVVFLPTCAIGAPER
jgi:hypothetical protein